MAIDSGLATQNQGAAAPTQQISFARKAPHISPRPNNRTPSAHLKDVSESHSVQVVSTDQAEDGSDKEDTFFPSLRR
jgi:hypothetical protein